MSRYLRRRGQKAAGGRAVSTLLDSRRLVALTDARTGTAHWVTDDAAAGRRAGGRYVAVCGVEVLAASLATPERAHCPSCARGPGEHWGVGRLGGPHPC